jgi:hypothetical protein
MKKILKEVSVAEMRGPLKKLMELISDEKLGNYWLYQLTLMMRKEPTHVLTKKWLEELSNKYTWEEAEKHFIKTGQLWFNYPEWPFQICVLEIGGISKGDLSKKWLDPSNSINHHLAENIKNFSMLSLTKKRKILLVRLQARSLGFSKEFKFAEINCSHPNFNFSQCPPETSFFMQPLVKKYFDSKATMVAMEFFPPDMVDKNKKRVFNFRVDTGHGNDIRMGVWDLSKTYLLEPSSWWIFQYNL